MKIISVNGCYERSGNNRPAHVDRSEWQAEFDKSLTDDRPSSSASDGDIGFNDDLLCTHGNQIYIFQLVRCCITLILFFFTGELSPDEAPRRLIQPEVWRIISPYFVDAKEFTSDTLPCELCAVLRHF